MTSACFHRHELVRLGWRWSRPRFGWAMHVGTPRRQVKRVGEFSRSGAAKQCCRHAIMKTASGARSCSATTQTPRRPSPADWQELYMVRARCRCAGLLRCGDEKLPRVCWPSFDISIGTRARMLCSDAADGKSHAPAPEIHRSIDFAVMNPTRRHRTRVHHAPSIALICFVSRVGGAPNMRAYSRLNCDALS